MDGGVAGDRTGAQDMAQFLPYACPCEIMRRPSRLTGLIGRHISQDRAYRFSMQTMASQFSEEVAVADNREQTQARKRGGLSMRRWRRSWVTFSCSLWIILAGAAAMLFCASDPLADDAVHPLMCLDASKPAVYGDHGAPRLTTNSASPSSARFLLSILFPATVNGHACWYAAATPSPLQTEERPTSFTPVSSQTVLRL